MYKLTSQCWYVSAAHVTQAFVVTTCLWCIWVCEDISFYSYESLLRRLDLTQAKCLCVSAPDARVDVLAHVFNYEGGKKTPSHINVHPTCKDITK